MVGSCSRSQASVNAALLSLIFELGSSITGLDTWIEIQIKLIFLLQGVSMAKSCSDAGVRAFPTWVIGGKILEGEQTFDKLDTELKALQEAVQKRASQ